MSYILSQYFLWDKISFKVYYFKYAFNEHYLFSFLFICQFVRLLFLLPHKYGIFALSVYINTTKTGGLECHPFVKNIITYLSVYIHIKLIDVCMAYSLVNCFDEGGKVGANFSIEVIYAFSVYIEYC